MSLEDEVNDIVTGHENRDAISKFVQDALIGVTGGFEASGFDINENRELFEKVVIETLHFIYFSPEHDAIE